MDTDDLIVIYRARAPETSRHLLTLRGNCREQDRLKCELNVLTSQLRMVLETIESAARLDLSASYVAAELVAMETQRADLREGAAHAAA